MHIQCMVWYEMEVVQHGNENVGLYHDNSHLCCCLTGKTAAFMLPILERLLYRPLQNPVSRVLVLTPTRELAIQVKPQERITIVLTQLSLHCITFQSAKFAETSELQKGI